MTRKSKQTSPTPPGPQRILIVDDTPSIHQDFRKILSPDKRETGELDTLEKAVFGNVVHKRLDVASYDLDSALSGEEALGKLERALAEDRPYQLAFIDVRMPPGWDGVETSSRLWAIDDQLQIVLCSAYSDHSWESIVSHLGRTDKLLFLKKPFEPIEVLQLASALCEKWALLRQKQSYAGNLEKLVRRRTGQLEDAYEQLRQEMASRLESEERLRQAEKLESLGQLTAGIAHEINNPLSFMLGNLSFLLKSISNCKHDVPAEEQEELCCALSEAIEGGNRIKRIVQDVIAFSRRDEDSSSPLDVRKALEAALNVSDTTRHSIGVVRNFESVQKTFGVKGRLEQVFVNIITNAATAMSDLPLEERELRISLKPDGEGFLSVEFVDRGRGVGSDHLSRVFDPFFTTNPVGEGTGLGLSVCHGTVAAMGGGISIESTLGEGTTVTILLPIIDESASE